MTTIKNIRKNIMGTLSFEMKLDSMRKFQDFIVYPKHNDDNTRAIKIQSNTRIGTLNLWDGLGAVSQAHPGGAYFIHLQIDKPAYFMVSREDCLAIKKELLNTYGAEVGNTVVKTDNSGVFNVL